MYTYMEYLQKCFYSSTNWNEDNFYSNITSTLQALLDFPIPNGFKIDISSNATEYLASSFTLSNYHSINGSIAYLYSSAALRNTLGTKSISLQDAISGFKMVEPYALGNEINEINVSDARKSALLYGRMYFPGAALEAMVIKRFSPLTQLLMKCVSNPNLNKNGTMIFYLQNSTPKFLRELIYSTNEALFGFRFLYNLSNSISRSQLQLQLIPKFDNSVLSFGSEIWYAASSTSPGISTALRYFTRSTSTGKPFTMTIACNPILGHISSTYSVKTSIASTFCSKYDFNWFSYASNLSVGFELYSFSNHRKVHFGQTTKNGGATNSLSTQPSFHLNTIPKPQEPIFNPIQNLDNYYHINPTLIPSQNQYSQEKFLADVQNASVMSAFQNLVDESNFASVLKASTSVNDMLLKVLWEGRFKDFLVSTGAQVSLNKQTSIPELHRIGITFSYAC